MIYYRMLWLAAALIGAANLLVFPYTDGLPCLLAALGCGIACGLTFNSAWPKR